MRKFLIVLLLAAFFTANLVAVEKGIQRFDNRVDTARVLDSLRGNPETGVTMGYCTLADLEGAYGTDRISAWSRLDPDKVDAAIRNATAEIDGYLISGGYTVPLAGPPENLKKYCVDIASARLVIGAGVLENDPGGKAVLEEAKNARHYLEKVAEGKFKIPGYINGEKGESKPPSGGVKVSASSRLDLRSF